MSAVAVLAAVAAGAAAATAAGPGRKGSPPRKAERQQVVPGADPDVGLLLRLRPVLVGLGFVAGWAFVGGPVGILAGLAVAALGWRVLGRSEGPATRRRREQLRADLPVAVHLLAEALRAGAAVEPALRVVAEAMPGPCGDALAGIGHRLRLGADPGAVWAELADNAEPPGLAALGRSMGRAYETGAAVADAIEALASELRARARSEVEQRAKGVDVRASAPLGACFLPAFVVLGVVPLIAGVFASLQLFG